MPRFLHVGCGQTPQSGTTPVLAGPEWQEVRLDISPDARPDILASMTDMSAVASASMDALYAHHTLEHLYAHEVPVALAEFSRVLRPEGFAIIGCPNLRRVGELLAAGKLMEPAYHSAAGPVSAHDMLYGLGAALARGHLTMAHHSGFTSESLGNLLHQAGFACVVKRQHGFNLTAYARKQATPDAQAEAWARTHFI